MAIEHKQKIALLSYTFESGGAGIAAKRLLHAFNEFSDFEVTGIQAMEPKHRELGIERADFPIALGDRLTNLSSRVTQSFGVPELKSPEYELFSNPFGPMIWKTNRAMSEASIINVHWIHGMSNPLRLMKTFPKKTWIFTLHDMWMLTGGCHYNGSCLGWNSGCMSCPAATHQHLISNYFTHKRNVIQRIRPTIITPSRWLAELASRSSICEGLSIHPISNSIDTQFWHPAPKNGKGLNILLVAENIGNFRKGGDLVQPFINKLNSISWNVAPSIIIAGRNSESFYSERLPLEKTGKIETSVEMRSIYQKATITVLLSRQDNLPNVVLESMACGTPVIAFNTGGIPEIISHEKNGLLVHANDLSAMCSEIVAFFNDFEKQKLFSENSFETMRSQFSPLKQVRSYEKVIEQTVKTF